MPKSTPMLGDLASIVTGSTSTTKLRKYRSALSLMTVTELGWLGSGRLQIGLTTPILARCTPFPCRENAFPINVADWLVLLFLNRGAPPFLWKNRWYALSKCLSDCCKATLDTSFNHAADSFSLVNQLDSWLYPTYFPTAWQ